MDFAGIIGMLGGSASPAKQDPPKDPKQQNTPGAIKKVPLREKGHIEETSSGFLLMRNPFLQYPMEVKVKFDFQSTVIADGNGGFKNVVAILLDCKNYIPLDAIGNPIKVTLEEWQVGMSRFEFTRDATDKLISNAQRYAMACGHRALGVLIPTNIIKETMMLYSGEPLLANGVFCKTRYVMKGCCGTPHLEVSFSKAFVEMMRENVPNAETPSPLGRSEHMHRKKGPILYAKETPEKYVPQSPVSSVPESSSDEERAPYVEPAPLSSSDSDEDLPISSGPSRKLRKPPASSASSVPESRPPIPSPFGKNPENFWHNNLVAQLEQEEKAERRKRKEIERRLEEERVKVETLKKEEGLKRLGEALMLSPDFIPLFVKIVTFLAPSMTLSTLALCEAAIPGLWLPTLKRILEEIDRRLNETSFATDVENGIHPEQRMLMMFRVFFLNPPEVCKKTQESVKMICATSLAMMNFSKAPL
jgi:hypothetical protein